MSAGEAPGAPAGLLLGIDGGGTKTEAAVGDVSGAVLGRGLGPASNLQWVGFEKMTVALRSAIDAAVAQVPGGRERPVAAACFGLAGVNHPADQQRLNAWIEDRKIAAKFTVLNDSELILAAGTPEAWGIALISGTGSVCLGRTADGRTKRVGGWGPLFGDEGSGHFIGLHALRLATQAADGRGAAHALCDALLRHLELGAPAELIDYAYHRKITPTDIAALARVVFELAEQGDAAANEIVDISAAALARHVEAVAAALDMHQPPLALGGGILRGMLRERVMARLGVEVGPVTLVADPVQGALTIAQRLVGGRAQPNAQ